jgi:hypothetical protein
MGDRTVVRARRLVSPTLGLLLTLAALREGAAAGAPAATEPIDRLPYKITVHLTIEPETRIDDRGRARLLDDWQRLVRRSIGAPWDLTIAEEEGTLSEMPPEALTPEAFAGSDEGFDKVWVIRIGREGPGYVLEGREFDVATHRLGPLQRRAVPVIPDLPRRLLEFAKDVFSPSALVGEQSGGGVAITVRGASLEPASPFGQVVAVGTVFQPLRIVSPPKGPARVLDVPFTYLRVEEIDGSTARCGIVSALRDPLTKRIAARNSLVALGLKPGRTPMRFRFVTRPDKAPAAGYVLTARDLPDGVPREVGTTDREGRVTLVPGFADGLVALRLLAGHIEPMVEFPTMPGETDVERTIPFEPRPQTVTLEAQLDSLRDAIIDLVAVRARLEARLKARADGEDWAGLEEGLKEFRQLPARETFAQRLTQLKDDAAEQQARTKAAILTKTAQAQITEVQSLIDRYLDDELFRAYAEALEKAKAPPPPKKGALPATKPGG